MSELLVCRGLPASGKTSFARQLVDSRPAGSIIRLNRDDLRAMCLPSSYGELDYRPEKLITQIQHSQITALLADGVDVIVDDTNMRARTVRTLAEFAVRAGAEWRVVDDFLAVPVEECIRRDTAREKSVGEEVIRRMWRKYLSHGQKLAVPVVDTAAVTGKPYVPPVWPRTMSVQGCGSADVIPVPGYGGNYFAGTDGEIYSTKGRLTDGSELKRLSASKVKGKHYSHVQPVLPNGKIVVGPVHLMVLAAFHGSRPGKLVGSHQDGDRTNNRPDNLAWESQAANLLRRIEHGTTDRGLSNSRSSMTEERLAEIRERLAGGETNRAIADALGVSTTTISRVRTGARYGSYDSPPIPKPTANVKWSAPKAIISDLDGTVALNRGRNPYDTSRYHEDAPNVPVVEVVQGERRSGMAIVFCSGRSEEFRAVTEDWIEKRVLPRSTGWELFMRPAGDTRNDAIVKMELFDQHIRDRYDVRRIYDDRDRVVRMWRSLGLTVLQVAPGDF